MNLISKLTSKLKNGGHWKLAAFVQTLPDFLGILVAGFAAYKVLGVAADDTLLTVLRIVVLIVFAAFWAIRFYERYVENKAET